jgi:K(+)-stimulated pyrophosphate-energized sodium pump
MAEVSELIYETCKTYMITQGKFILLILEVFIGVIIVAYFGWVQHMAASEVAADPHLLADRHRRLLRRGLVRHPHQHAGQQPHGLRLAEGKPFPVYAIPMKSGISSA